MKLLFICITYIIVSTGQLYAHEHHNDHGERVQHYQADKPKNIQEALSILNSKSQKVGQILFNTQLSANDLEEIHEMSYSLEAAIDYLRETKQYDHSKEETLDKLDEAIQALHYFSENHKDIETREWFSKMQSIMVQINDIF